MRAVPLEVLVASASSRSDSPVLYHFYVVHWLLLALVAHVLSSSSPRAVTEVAIVDQRLMIFDASVAYHS